MFTWSDHWETDLLSSSSVTSKTLNRLRSSAGISFKDSFSKYCSGVEGNQNTLLKRYMEVFFACFKIEKLKTKQEDKALLSLRHLHFIFCWFTVTLWQSILLKILYCIFSLPFKKMVPTPFKIIINTSFLLWNCFRLCQTTLYWLSIKEKKQIYFSAIVFNL